MHPRKARILPLLPLPIKIHWPRRIGWKPLDALPRNTHAEHTSKNRLQDPNGAHLLGFQGGVVVQGVKSCPSLQRGCPTPMFFKPQGLDCQWAPPPNLRFPATGLPPAPHSITLCGAGCEHQTAQSQETSMAQKRQAARLLLLLLVTPGRKQSLWCEGELCQRPICTKKPKDSQVQRRGYRSWAR